MKKLFFVFIILVSSLQSCENKSIETEMDEYCDCRYYHIENKLSDHSKCDLLLREIYSRQSENLDSLQLIEDKKTECWFQF